jgi:N-acetylglucosaminyl-diphospho-decaprenol L-rhamnosyltransferase
VPADCDAHHRHTRARSAPDLSVSIVNTNSRDLLLGCLESLQQSVTGDFGVELVVLDNASDDGSADAVRERFPGVRVIAQEFRAGFGANHNTVIRSTSGRYVYVLNEDTTSDDWGFARIVEYLDANPRVAALGPRLVYPEGRHQSSAWRFPTPSVSALGLLTLGKVGVEQSRGSEPRAVDWAMGAALFLRREALDEVGLFDEDFFIYSEEVDLCLRLRRAGWKTRYFPGVTVVHHESQFSADVPERRINEMWRSRHRYWRKHHSPAGARVAALATGAQYALRSGAAGIVRRDAAFRARMRLHARDSWRVDGPGLRELAEEWNGRVGARAR